VLPALVGLVLALGSAHLVAYGARSGAVAGVLKPLPVLALAWAVAHGPLASATYGERIVAGLLLSAVGDVSLAFPAGFLAGLSAFFLAHLGYIGAFAPGAVPTPAALVAAVLLAAFSLGMLRYLWPHVAALRVPVTVYVAALATMAWCAIARALSPGAPAGATAGAVGAVSFLVSDGVLAVDRFARPFAGAYGVVMATYYAAQLLIAASAL
jgi:uncharacterized membrane protein YhhN